MCKKLKVFPEPYILKHYLDGDWNKDYNRRETVSSMVNFMRDPSGDLPWDEDSTAVDILHIPDNNVHFFWILKMMIRSSILCLSNIHLLLSFF